MEFPHIKFKFNYKETPTMKHSILIMSLSCLVHTATAQTYTDSTDVFYQHLKLNEVVVSGLTGQSKLTEMPAPVSVMSLRDLQSSVSTNIIDAIAHQPGVSQITTGGGISKPVIRGLGYNRVAVVQEGQQWGDEHGIEIDAQSVGSVEILKGPASLMYGSDAMAGVIVFKPQPIMQLGKMSAQATTEYQSNNGLFDYSVNFTGNQKGMVWDARWSQKIAHTYKNRRDGYVPGSQYREQAARAMVGLNRQWGFSHLILGYYHLTPGIIEGERDETTGDLEWATTSHKTYGRTLPFQQVYHYKAVLDNSFYLGKGTMKALVGYQQNRRQEYEESADEYELYFQLHTLNYDLRYLVETDDGWKFAFGIAGMYQRSLNKGEEVLIPAYHLFDTGTYATASKKLGQWYLTGGLRIDRRQLSSEEAWEQEDAEAMEQRFEAFHRHFTGVSGSVGAVCHVTDQLNLRANLSRGYRAPNMSELGSNGVHEGTVRYEVGNNHLKAEHSWQLDFGADYTSKYLSAQVALFANRIDNYVYARRTEKVFEADHSTYRYSAGDARLMGFEVTADVHPVHCLHFGNTFSWVDAVQLHQPKESKYLPFTPPARWTSELKYDLLHNGRVLSNAYLAANMECHLRQYHYFMIEQTETATPSYTLLHASAGSDIKSGSRRVASVYLMVNNLFDRAYQSHLSRLKYTDINNRTGQQGVFNMGRNIVLKVVMPLF